MYTALSEHNMVIGREAHDAVAMLACALLTRKRYPTWCYVAKALGVKDKQTLLKVPVKVYVETFST